MEVLLPFITARIIDEGLNGENLSAVYRYGALMVVMAMLSLLFGTLAGKYAASASSGFACNLRESLYEKIRTFSFSNIDKFCRGVIQKCTQNLRKRRHKFAERKCFILLS
jgi:ATP-binding cassette subfamily B multidrug efflux pump